MTREFESHLPRLEEMEIKLPKIPANGKIIDESIHTEVMYNGELIELRTTYNLIREDENNYK